MPALKKYAELLRWMKETGRIAQQPWITQKRCDSGFLVVVSDERLNIYPVEWFETWDEANAFLKEIDR